MKEIKIYLDLEKIEEETGRRFDVEGEYSDNFLQWIQYLAWCIATGSADEKAEELKDILDNCYSEWNMKSHKI